MWHLWIPTMKDLHNCVDQKLHEFAAQENHNPRWSKDSWLQRYIYTEDNEVFFTLFTCKLNEWLYKLAECQPT